MTEIEIFPIENIENTVKDETDKEDPTKNEETVLKVEEQNVKNEEQEVKSDDAVVVKKSFREREKEKIPCEFCEKIIC